MRTSLACNVSLRHFGVWKSAVWLLALLSVAALAGWLVSGRDLWPTGAWVAAAAAAMTVPWLASSIAQAPAVNLRLHEGHWTVTQDRQAGAEAAQAGELDVAIDLGSFMLLSFRPVLASGRRGARRWLPAQRRGHEHDWHALRCAVFSARPAPAGAAARAAAPPE